jgi:hypothetical protein
MLRLLSPDANARSAQGGVSAAFAKPALKEARTADGGHYRLTPRGNLREASSFASPRIFITQ